MFDPSRHHVDLVHFVVCVGGAVRSRVCLTRQDICCLYVIRFYCWYSSSTAGRQGVLVGRSRACLTCQDVLSPSIFSVGIIPRRLSVEGCW